MKKIFSLEKICAVFGVIAVGLIGYGKYWESKQQSVIIKNVSVLSADQSRYHSDLSSSISHRVKVDGEEKRIYFPNGKWDTSIQKGEYVNIVAEKNFPVFASFLTGVSVRRSDENNILLGEEICLKKIKCLEKYLSDNKT